MPVAKPGPFDKYMWLLNERIESAADVQRVGRRLERTTGVRTFVPPGEKQKGKRKHPLFADPAKYDVVWEAEEQDGVVFPVIVPSPAKDDRERLQRLQKALRECVEALARGDLAWAQPILKHHLQGGVQLDVEARPGEDHLTLRVRFPAPDLRVWYALAEHATRKEWLERLGICKIEGCSNRYFAKKRKNQEFCSQRHTILWAKRRARGLDPATGKPRS